MHPVTRTTQSGTERDLPAAIVALGPDVSGRVQHLVRDAERRQVEEADRALDKALGMVPRPFRGVVKKVLVG